MPEELCAALIAGVCSLQWSPQAGAERDEGEGGGARYPCKFPGGCDKTFAQVCSTMRHERRVHQFWRTQWRAQCVYASHQGPFAVGDPTLPYGERGGDQTAAGPQPGGGGDDGHREDSEGGHEDYVDEVL